MTVVKPLISKSGKIVEAGAAEYIAPGNLGSGTPTGSNFLNGANQWSVVPSWLRGEGEPDGALGIIGDFYIDTTNYAYYNKIGEAAWEWLGVLQGPAGENGANGGDGTNFFAGAADPSPFMGNPPDHWLNTLTGDVFIKVGATTWELEGNIMGPAGADGSDGTNGSNGVDGATWYTGSGAPDNGAGAVNDLYINTANGDYYKKTGVSTWTLQGNLTGPAAAGSYPLGVTALSSSPNDSQSLHFGSVQRVPTVTGGISRIYIPTAGTITMARIFTYAGSAAGSAEAVSMYVRLNNTTDTLIQTLSVSTNERTFVNTGLSIAVVAEDYIEIKMVTPAWATNPTGFLIGGYVFIET